jgi:hypothetical protein
MTARPSSSHDSAQLKLLKKDSRMRKAFEEAAFGLGHIVAFHHRSPSL